MNLKFRFAFLFTFFVFIIQMASVIAIYLLFEDFRSDDFRKRIKQESIATIVTKINADSTGLKEIRYNPTGTLYYEKILVYSEKSELLYTYPDTLKPADVTGILNQLKKSDEKSFVEKDRDGVAIKMRKNNSNFYILASAYDEFGIRKNKNLQYILFFTVLGSLLLSGLFAFLYVLQIIKPLGELNAQMQLISESNLTERVSVGKNNDELSRTASTFNAMLNRLQQAFETRKSFVHHASHELRTPLASMLSQTELALNKDLTPDEYKKVLRSLAEDQEDLIDLTNSLLLLSQFESSSFSFDWVPQRVDELLYETIEIFTFQQKQAVVSLDFKTLPEDSAFLTIKGNHSLLISAFRNLIKNACLYSDDCHVSIFISADEKGIAIDFENNGKQMTAEESKKLFIPFFRGENSAHIKGTGLGLSIVQRIINLHNGDIRYEAVDNLNRFIITLPA